MKSDIPAASRRHVLEAIGGAVALGGISKVGSAKRDLREIIDRAHRIREKTNSQKKFLRYLRNQGLAVANQRQSYTISRNDGLGVQKLSEADLTTDITLVYRYYQCTLEEIYTEYSWTWDVSEGFGDVPEDGVSMGWPLDHYSYDGQTSGERTTHLDAHADGGGSAWEYDDTQLAGGSSHSSYAGCYLTEESTDEDRHVGAKYRHTYQDGNLEDWSWSVDSQENVHWVPSYSEDTEVWKGGFESIYKSEADEEFTNC